MEQILADAENPMGSLMDAFRWSQIWSSFVFGVIGLFLFRYAKKKSNWKLVYVAVALMIYPIFTPNWVFDWGVGVGLCMYGYWLDQNAELTG